MGVLFPVVIGILMVGPPLTTAFTVLIVFGLSYEWLKLAHIQTKIEKRLFYGILLGSLGVFLVVGMKGAFAFLFGVAALVYYGMRSCKGKGRKKHLEIEKKNAVETRRENEIIETLENCPLQILEKSEHCGWFFLGLLYIGVPCLSFLGLYERERGYTIVLWMLFMIWACDIGAYLIGSWLKGPKIAPRISPKKTWSGFFGGFFCAEVAGVLSGEMFGFDSKNVFFLGLGVIVFAVLGDLLESYLKRCQKIKDTGSFIPGHGGLFDRLDSTLAVLPLVAFVLWITNGAFFK